MTLGYKVKSSSTLQSLQLHFKMDTSFELSANFDAGTSFELCFNFEVVTRFQEDTRFEVCISFKNGIHEIVVACFPVAFDVHCVSDTGATKDFDHQKCIPSELVVDVYKMSLSTCSVLHAN